LARNVEFFLAHLEDSRRPPSESETAISHEDSRMLKNIVGKDRGPFLYWLVSEATTNERKELGVLLGQLGGSGAVAIQEPRLSKSPLKSPSARAERRSERMVGQANEFEMATS